MTYQEVIEWLFCQLPNYQLQGGSAYKPGLDNIKAVLNTIDNPQDKIKTIHVAGTNGKGSVSHILASAFIENDYKTGLFTSPHILDFRERIKINGKPISKEFVVKFVEENRDFWIEQQASFFEINTAMAFAAFEAENCDVSIIETGLGGRLDSTNVIQPELSIITNISLDHTNFLGNTIEEVAFEKAGIIKNNTPVVIGERQKELVELFQKISNERNSKIIFADTTQNFTSDLIGSYQQKNLRTAYTALKEMSVLGWSLNQDKLLESFTKVQSNTGFQGRMQVLSENPKIIMDAAHNENGLENLLKEIDLMEFESLHIIYGSSKDKDINSIFNKLPKKANYYLTTFDSQRSMTESDLKNHARSTSLNFELFNSPKSALEQAILKSKPEDLILIFGSFFLMESILS